MQDNNIDILIAGLLANNITDEQRKMLDNWLSESPDNRKYLGQMINLWQSSHPAFDPADIQVEDAIRNVHRKTVESDRLTQRKSFNMLVWWQRIAAVLFIPVVMLMGYFLSKDTDINPEIAYQEVFSPYGVRSKIGLPDGSSVWLNSGSQLKYPLEFRSGSRKVYLTGEAYFEVKSDKKNPFIVNTALMDVEATGTAFNVEAYTEDTITAVTLVHGIVDVDINGRRKMNLQPNQRICYNNHSNKYQLANTDPYKWIAWKDGVLAFRDDRLDYVFKKIGMMYNVEISVKDTEIASHLYRATFEGESLDEILNLLKLSAPIKYVHTKRVRSVSGAFSKEKIEVYKK